MLLLTFAGSLVRSIIGGLASDKQGLKPTGVDSSKERTVFEGGLGAAPDKGGNTGTYSELCSLVNDMGQPELIYKFMGLAAHGQMWNARAGMSLGLATIAAKAERELRPFLPQLIPKLFRYQFDPTPKVQQSMRAMWAALVPDSKAAVDAHFDAILLEALKGCGQRQWLGGLIQGGLVFLTIWKIQF